MFIFSLYKTNRNLEKFFCKKIVTVFRNQLMTKCVFSLFVIILSSNFLSASIVPENGLDSIQNNIENNFRGKSISIGITLTHFSPSKGDKNIDYSTNLFE